jgi:hypothetical protein
MVVSFDGHVGVQGGQGQAALACGFLVDGDARFDRVVAEAPAGPGGEQGVVAHHRSGALRGRGGPDDVLLVTW